MMMKKIAGILRCVVFLLILVISFLLDGAPEIGTQALIECAGCLVGGGIAGVLAGGKKKKKRKTR